MKNIINFITSTVLTSFVYLLGGLDIALKALLIFIVLDYVTGICKDIRNKKLNSSIGGKGIKINTKKRAKNHSSKRHKNGW